MQGLLYETNRQEKEGQKVTKGDRSNTETIGRRGSKAATDLGGTAGEPLRRQRRGATPMVV